MTQANDDQLTPKERAEITKRKLELENQKKANEVIELSDLKKELGLPSSRGTR